MIAAKFLVPIAVLLSLGISSAQSQTLFAPSGIVGSSGNGNVGIGTAFPAQKLTIQAGHGDTRLTLFSDNFLQGIDGPNTALLSLWASEPGVTWGGVGIGNNIIVPNGITRITNSRGGSYIRLLDNAMQLSVVDANGADRSGITINSLSNVGIGTTIPRQKLEVGAESNPSINIHDFGTAELTLGINESIPIAQFNTNSSGFRFVVGQDGINFPGTGSEVVRFSNSGNVGIGTSAPLAKLHIKSNYNGEVGLMIEASDTADPEKYNLRLQPYVLGAGMVGYKFQTKSDVGGTNVPLSFSHDGNVGIGTTNPTHKLAVNGTIKAKEIIVETTGWSDYVFADDYALAPLAEVEAHIKANKHLPGIPSAAEVTEQGVSLGDMQAKLLAKIEELTLHQIAQEKRALQQQTMAIQQAKEIAALKDKIQQLTISR